MEDICIDEPEDSFSHELGKSQQPREIQRPSSAPGTTHRAVYPLRPDRFGLRSAGPHGRSVSHPQRPRSAQPLQPGSGRTSRFLQETLTKLSEDSLRSGSPDRLTELSVPFTSSGVRQLYNSQDMIGCGFDTLIRSAFRDEARDLLEEGDISKCILGWSQQFSEWHNQDSQVALRVQADIEELVRLCQHVLAQLTNDEWCSFKVSLSNWIQRFDDLLKPSEGGRDSLLLSCVEKAVGNKLEQTSASIIGELSSAAGACRQVAEQKETDEGRWAQLWTRMQRLEDRMIRVADEISCQDDRIQGRFECLLGELTAKAEATMRCTVRDVDASVNMLQGTFANECLAVKQHFDRLIVGEPHEADSPEKSEDIRGLLKKVWDNGVVSHEHAQRWQEVAETSKAERLELQQELQRSKVDNDALHKKLQTLDAEMKGLETQLGATKTALSAPLLWNSMVSQLDEVQGNGNLKIDLQSGEAEVLKGMSFAPCKPSETPIARVVDADAAEGVLADMATLMTIFKGVAVRVESHCKPAKGPAAFWDKLTTNRADFVKKSLEERGLDVSLVTTKGLPGTKGLNKPCVKLKVDLFPSAILASPRRNSSLSPPRSRAGRDRSKSPVKSPR